MRAYILHGAVRCGAGAGLKIEVCGAVRAPALDDGAVRCGCGPLHCGAVRSRAKLLGLYIIVSPVRSTYGGYYGLVVVTPRARPPPPPRPQTLHRSHHNLKNPYRIASIFYMQIDIGERMPGKQDWPSRIIYGPPRPPPPPNSPKCACYHIGAHI